MLMRSITSVEMISVKAHDGTPLLLRAVADVTEGTTSGQIDRYNMRRVVSMTANIAGEDLGRVAGRIDRAIASAGPPPVGCQVDVRGQAAPCSNSFGAWVWSCRGGGSDFLAH